METRYIHTVQYYETDKMGITHHSNYIRWMEEARVDFLKKIGWDYDKLEALGVFSPVLSVECRYKAPTAFAEEVNITVAVTEFRGVKLKIRYTMTNAKGRVVCEGVSEHGFLNAEGRPPALGPRAAGALPPADAPGGGAGAAKRGRKRLLFLLPLLLVLLAGAAVLVRNPHYLYVAGEYLGLNCRRIERRQVEPEGLVSVTLEELEGEENVRFDQSLLLVSAAHPLPEDFVPDVTEYRDSGVYMNNCMQEAFAALSDAVREHGESGLYVSSDFRTRAQQEEEYAADPALAALPGSSEHEAGLALDVYVRYFAGYAFHKSRGGQFVGRNGWKYGFILRYPSFGEKETGITYEPWHIRYVGQPHASLIYNGHTTLEGYIDSLHEGVWYEAQGYRFCRQRPRDGALLLPEERAGAVVSPDNTGCYIVTIPNEGAA